jgi:small-conductance mechanosensitive channel
MEAIQGPCSGNRAEARPTVRGKDAEQAFGELRSITNWSRDWVIEKLELGVTYDTDIDKVRKILKRVGIEMLNDPELAPNILEPLKSQGVSKMADFSIVVRAKFMAKPGEQFAVRREAFRRIKRAFDENGVRFAFPTVIVHPPPGGAPARRDEDASSAAAAARAALDGGSQQAV